MKTVSHTKRAKDKLLHIEAEGCVINVRIDLTSDEGQPVTSIQITPDNYCGEQWKLLDFPEHHNGINVRVGMSGKEEPTE